MRAPLLMLLLVTACGRRPPEPVPNAMAPGGGSRVVAEVSPVQDVTVPPGGVLPALRLGVLPPGVGVPVGDEAPEATLTDAAGAPVDLGALYAAGPVLLVFYRGDGCARCSARVRELATDAARFQALGVTPVLVSPDPIAAVAAVDEIPFPLLTDPGLVAHDAWRVTDRYTRAVPSAFLVVDGRVRWAHADRETRSWPTADQLLDAVQTTMSR